MGHSGSTGPNPSQNSEMAPQVCGVSKAESRGREFSNITRFERVFLYVGALAMGGHGGSHWCTPDALKLNKNELLIS